MHFFSSLRRSLENIDEDLFNPLHHVKRKIPDVKRVRSFHHSRTMPIREEPLMSEKQDKRSHRFLSLETPVTVELFKHKMICLAERLSNWKIEQEKIR
jgi:hypothetical protein